MVLYFPVLETTPRFQAHSWWIGKTFSMKVVGYDMESWNVYHIR
jgi:hypothetical protein